MASDPAINRSGGVSRLAILISASTRFLGSPGSNPWHHHLDLEQLQLAAGQYIVRLSDGKTGEERKIVFIQ